MWPSQSKSLTWFCFAAGLFLLGHPPNVEAASLTTHVQVRSLSGVGGCLSSDSDQATAGTSNSSDSCGASAPFDSSAEGSARANFGSLGVEFSTTTSIPVFELGAEGGTYLAEGNATATSFERVTIDSGPASGVLAIGFDLDGTLEFLEEGPQDARDSFASISLKVSGAINGTYFEQIGRSGPPQSGELTFLLPYDGGFADIEIILRGDSACGRVDAIGALADYTCMTSANYFTSATVTGLDVFDNAGSLVADAIVTSESGFDYQAGFPNTVPIPSTLLFFGVGFAGFAAWRYRIEKKEAK